MSETTNLPAPNLPEQTAVVTPTIEQTPQKRKYPLALISLLLILILAVAGEVYYYFNLRQTSEKGITTTLVTPSAPTKSPESTPTTAEISSSTDPSVLEKELNDTDVGSFEQDLNQLDLDAGQL
jgi:hypothetical protein